MDHSMLPGMVCAVEDITKYSGGRSSIISVNDNAATRTRDVEHAFGVSISFVRRLLNEE